MAPVQNAETYSVPARIVQRQQSADDVQDATNPETSKVGGNVEDLPDGSELPCYLAGNGAQVSVCCTAGWTSADLGFAIDTSLGAVN